MSNLTPCPGCSNPVSRLAISCPKCGTPLNSPTGPEGPPRKGIPRLVVLAAVLFALLGLRRGWQQHLQSAPPAGSAGLSPGTADLRQADFGRDWPFRVPTVQLICKPDPGHPDSPYLLAAAGGRTYALDWSPAHADPANAGYADIDEILKDDPAGTKMPLQPLIDRAMALCHRP